MARAPSFTAFVESVGLPGSTTQSTINPETPVVAQMQTALTAMANDDAEYARIDALSIPEWLAGDARLVPTDLVRRVLELAYLEEFGLEVEQQSAWNLITLIDSATTEPFHVFGDSDERFHIHEGSDAIATAMATELGDQVHLDHALTKVTEAEGMFELTFVTSAGTSTTTVAHIVYALPFTKLREVDLAGSALTAGKRTAWAPPRALRESCPGRARRRSEPRM